MYVYIIVSCVCWSWKIKLKKKKIPGADVGSDHDIVMMTFQTRLKNSRKPTQPRIRFDLEKLNDPTAIHAFKTTICGRSATLAQLVDEDADLDSMVTHQQGSN